jgi:hypothetical protein
MVLKVRSMPQPIPFAAGVLLLLVYLPPSRGALDSIASTLW